MEHNQHDKKSFFITGTGTEIGKTTISAWLCTHFGCDYFKPIQTGTAHDTADSVAVQQLSRQCTVHPSVYSFGAPYSPHIAAQLEGSEILSSNITLPITTRPLIVEGAGGVMVPINGELLLIDLMLELKMPAIVVASAGLGTINHTLLTVLALRSYGIKVCGIILNNIANIDAKDVARNAQSIEKYSDTEILDVLSYLNNTDDLHTILPSAALHKLFANCH